MDMLHYGPSYGYAVVCGSTASKLVAKLAGMPQTIVKRADQVLKHLESNNRQDSIGKNMSNIAEERGGVQLS